MSTIRFEEVSDRLVVTGKCSRCGKRKRKVFREWQTINPWNDKSRTQIHFENRQRLRERSDAHDFTCDDCQPLASRSGVAPRPAQGATGETHPTPEEGQPQ